MSHPTWVRGLKCLVCLGIGKVSFVAPHVGAWIEIHEGIIYPYNIHMSHPTWVRGLKCTIYPLPNLPEYVAPHVGAWIEISAYMDTPRSSRVAPHVGAWIEITRTAS